MQLLENRINDLVDAAIAVTTQTYKKAIQDMGDQNHSLVGLYMCSLVPRPYLAYTLKSGRAWYLKSRAWVILLCNKQLEKADKINRLFFMYGALWLIVEHFSTA